MSRFAERLFDFPRLYRAKYAVTGAVLRVVRPLLFRTIVRTEDLVAEARIDPGSSVCEIGCGDGENYRMVSSLVERVRYTGIDINPAMIRQCMHDHPEQRWLVATPPYPFPDAAFDYALIVNVLHHLDSRRAAVEMLSEARRIARTTLLFEPLQSEGPLLSAIKSAYWAVTDGGSRYLRLAEMRALIAEAGGVPAWERFSQPLHHFYAARLSARSGLPAG